MNKKEFLERLSQKLSGLSKEEREERLAFYSEMIDDRIEEGLTEEAAVASIDPVEDIPEEKTSPRRRWTAGEIILLVLGSPLWLSLLIAAFAVVFSLYVSLWAILVSLWAVFGALVGCTAGGIIGGAGFVVSGHVPAGLALVGAGLVCGGLSIGFFYGCHWATKGMLLLTRRVVSWIFRKGKAQ